MPQRRASGQAARKAVLAGKKTVTSDGLRRADLKVNPQGKVVSRARSNASARAARGGGSLTPRLNYGQARAGRGLFTGLGNAFGLSELGRGIDDLSKVVIRSALPGAAGDVLLSLDDAGTVVGGLAGNMYKGRRSGRGMSKKSTRRGRGLALPGY